ncbi:MAG: (2,3-dihydroxybenzoyl)adenylate synthase, partial [Gemmatimonas sp.]
IPRTHDDYLYSVVRSAEICALSPRTVYMAALPIAHNYPMSSPGYLGVFYAGGTVVMCPSPDAATAFALVAKERVTITGVVPPIALMWLDAARSMSPDLSSLEVLQVGGAKLSAEVAKQVTPVLGAKLQQVFGMAEGLVNYTRLDDPLDIIINTQGRPMCPDDEIRIVDDHDQPVPEGDTGFLLTRGPYTIRAYHNAPEANARAFTDDGFYRTGDVVRRTAGQNLIVEGRATDRINRGGEKISADEIEDHLLAHPQVHDAAVIGVEDEMFGEKTCAYIVPRGEAPRAATLRAWIRSRGLAAFKVPDQIEFVDAFPTTGVGKISRKQLRAALREYMTASRAPKVEN